VTRHPAPGRVARLTAGQQAQIPGLLERGAEAYGFRGDVWTATRVAEEIKQRFGVRYARSCQRTAAPSGLESAAAERTRHPTGDATRRGDNPPVERGAGADAQKRADAQRTTIVSGTLVDKRRLALSRITQLVAYFGVPADVFIARQA